MKKLILVLLSVVYSAGLTAGPKDILRIYNWNGSLSETTIKQFEKSCQCRVQQDFYSDNEEMLAKLATGARGYDMVFPSSFVVQVMVKRKLLMPLDHTKLGHLKNIHPSYLSQSYDMGNRYSIPTVLTLTSVGFNVERLQQLGVNPNSWAVIFDPAILQKIKGKVTVLDSSREVFTSALLYLGKDPNTGLEADYKAARDVIKRAKPYWAAFSNASYVKQLTTGNIWVSLGYSSDFFQAQEDAKQAKRPFRIANVAQKEGNELGIDTMAILSSAKRPDLAHQFINFMLDGKNAAQLTNLNGSINPVKTAAAFFRTDLKVNRIINPSESMIKKWTVLRELNAKERRMLARLWTEVKASR